MDVCDAEDFVESDEDLVKESSEELASEDDECTRQMKRQKARELIKENKLTEAIGILELIQKSQSKLVLLTECYLQVDQLPLAVGCVMQLKQEMTSSPRPPVSHVMQLANQFIKSGHTIRAMSLLVCVSKLHRIDSTPDDAVVAIRNCSSMIDDVIRSMKNTKQKERILEFGLTVMNEILKDLRAVEKASPGIKADMEARCLCDIGLSSRASKNSEKALESFKAGIRVMKKQFGLNATKFQIFGHLCNNMAIIYRMRQQYGKALKHYQESLVAYTSAVDWESTFIKNKRVQSTNVNMALLKRKMEC